MLKTLAGRLGAALAVLFAVSLLTFCALHVVPGDMATLVLGTDATPEALQQLRESMGLDRTLPEQYVSWICGVLTGDWGMSRTYAAPVWQVIVQALPPTLLLAVYATAVALVVSCALGCASALRPGGAVDVVSRTVMQLASAVPGFWLAVMCMLVFAAGLGWFPVSGYAPFTQDPLACLRSLTLPALVLACGETGVLIRTVRSAVMDSLRQEYMLATQVKGLTRVRTVVVYVLRSSLAAPITVAGVQMAKLVGGTAAIERVFALPGLGNLLLGAVEQRDVMLVQGIVVFVTAAVVVVNLLVDVLAARAGAQGAPSSGAAGQLGVAGPVSAQSTQASEGGPVAGVRVLHGRGGLRGREAGRRTGRATLVGGLVLVGAVAAMGALSLVWTPYDVSAMDLASRFAAPSLAHPFGCDQFGRDILSRCMAAAVPALAVGVGSVVLGSLVGAALGAMAAMGASGVRAVIMRVTDALMSFPGILLAMVLVLVLGRGLTSVLIAVAVFMVPVFARLTCQLVQEVASGLYVKAARVAGLGPFAVLVRHILPNVAPLLLTQLTARIGSAMLLEASLSFLGLGVQPPMASWGYMLSEALPYVTSYPLLAVAPGALLMAAALGWNLIGDALNDRILRRGVR